MKQLRTILHTLSVSWLWVKESVVDSSGTQNWRTKSQYRGPTSNVTKHNADCPFPSRSRSKPFHCSPTTKVAEERATIQRALGRTEDVPKQKTPLGLLLSDEPLARLALRCSIPSCVDFGHIPWKITDSFNFIYILNSHYCFPFFYFFLCYCYMIPFPPSCILLAFSSFTLYFWGLLFYFFLFCLSFQEKAWPQPSPFPSLHDSAHSRLNTSIHHSSTAGNY